jgi:hypothetical protein
MYFASDVVTGSPMLAPLAVLLGNMVDKTSSVNVRLYDNPIMFFPNILMKKYAILTLIVLFVMAFDIATTKNISHGTNAANPEIPCVFISTVPVRALNNRERNKVPHKGMISIMTPTMLAEKMMSICQALADSPTGDGMTNQTTAEHKTIINNGTIFMSL